MNSDHLQIVARAYARHRGITLSTLGTYAANHGKFFERLREGRVTVRRASEVFQWLSANWPEDLEWPPDASRPWLDRRALEALEACESAIGDTLRRERVRMARIEGNARRPRGRSPAGKREYADAMLEAAGAIDCRIKTLNAARESALAAIGSAKGKAA